jgi:hypothetical protein
MTPADVVNAPSATTERMRVRTSATEAKSTYEPLRRNRAHTSTQAHAQVEAWLQSKNV